MAPRKRIRQTLNHDIHYRKRTKRAEKFYKSVYQSKRNELGGFKKKKKHEGIRLWDVH
jgi:hypothetical protein